MPALAFSPSLLSRKSSKSNERHKRDFHSSPLSPGVTSSSSQSVRSRSRSSEKKLAVETDPEVIQRQPSVSGSTSGASSTTSSSSRSGRSVAERPADTLSLVLGDDLRVRRSKCAAEFLEEVVKGGPEALEALSREVGRRLKVVGGAEAVALYKKFVGWVFSLFLIFGD